MIDGMRRTRQINVGAATGRFNGKIKEELACRVLNDAIHMPGSNIPELSSQMYTGSMFLLTSISSGNITKANTKHPYAQTPSQATALIRYFMLSLPALLFWTLFSFSGSH